MSSSADFLQSAIYLPGVPSDNPGPLARYLPPLPEGAVAEWLQSRIPPGSLILDPFGASPRLVVEAARAGYWILVAANNPIARFLLEIYANPAIAVEYRSALAELASMRRGPERLEPHIRTLYLTQCENCKSEIEAQAFLWERGSSVPYAKIYTCPVCGDSEMRDTNQQDVARAEDFSQDKLHRARALERVAAVDDTERSNVEEALNTYLPRAVYVLFTLINKLDGMSLPADRRRLIDALLLYVFDQANSLWAHPIGRARPRQLTVPPRFRENNIWLALEDGIQELARLNFIPLEPAHTHPKIPVLIWPDLPGSSAGITVFEGRLKELADSIQTNEIRAVVGAIPRPNQAFWTLSALWSGWLWGREAVGPFRSVLRRRRYDWGWHCTALHSAMENLYRIIIPDTPFLGLIGETEPGYISSAIVAAQTAGFVIRGISLRAENGQAQIHWEKPAHRMEMRTASSRQLDTLASQAALEYIRERGEPASYLQIYTAALASLSHDNQLARVGRNQDEKALAPGEVLALITGIIEGAFSYKSGFLRYGGSDKSLEIGQWWLREERLKDGKIEAPLADRVEVELVRYLLQNPGKTYQEIDRSMCAAFPGFLTPSSELIDTILESYGQLTGVDRRWQIRIEDRPRGRRNDLDSIRKTMVQIGVQLGYSIEGEYPQLWIVDHGESHSSGQDRTGVDDRPMGNDQSGGELVDYVFYLIASAAIGEIIQNNSYRPEKSIIVLPGSRAGLLMYKLKHNAHLNQMVESGWRFLKFRHVYRLFKDQSLSRQNLDENLGLDPLQDLTGQMRLL
jgi:hypothetical protein